MELQQHQHLWVQFYNALRWCLVCGLLELHHELEMSLVDHRRPSRVGSGPASGRPGRPFDDPVEEPVGHPLGEEQLRDEEQGVCGAVQDRVLAVAEQGPVDPPAGLRLAQ